MGKKALIAFSVVIALVVGALGVFVQLMKHDEGIAFLNRLRYAPGEHAGAESCKECHEEIYDQWKMSSRHAIATTAESVREVIHGLERHRILNYVLGGEEMCYRCHGPKAHGVDCETCHGPALPGVDMGVSHEKVFGPNRVALRKEDFCATCHEIPGWVTPYGDWQQTDLRGRGITCQRCHMEQRGGDLAYHGFDSFARDQSIYEGDLDLSDLHLTFPTLSLVIENRVDAHGVPAGGPTRILSLEVAYLGADGRLLHQDGKLFAKFHRVMPVLGFWPYEIVKNTQLKTGEKRHLTFTLPPDLESEVRTVRLLLRFYEVADEHEGDITKAYFVSDPILEKTLRL